MPPPLGGISGLPYTLRTCVISPFPFLSITMVIESTPYINIINALNDDREKLEYHAWKYLKQAQKYFLENPRNATHHIRYTHPQSKNTYLLWSMRELIGPDNIPAVFRGFECKCGSCLMINTSSGGRTVFTIGGPEPFESQLFVFTDHMFHRYRERCKYPDSMSTEDIITHFFTRNGSFVDLDYDKMHSYQNSKGSRYCHQIPDGVVFGTKEEIEDERGRKYSISKVNTFVSKDMLTRSQLEEYRTDESREKKIREHVKRAIQSMPEMAPLVRPTGPLNQVNRPPMYTKLDIPFKDILKNSFPNKK